MGRGEGEGENKIRFSYMISSVVRNVFNNFIFIFE